MHADRGPRTPMGKPMRPILRPSARKFANLELAGVSGDGTFSGYASVFGEVDLGKDRIERGAFANSLVERGARGVRMLYQHDPAEPIGAWTVIREDARGLYVEGRLAPGVGRAAEVFSLMKSGALDGLSIGFRTVKARSDPKSGVRRILEADLWEISVVTFPMLPSARVSDVKHARFFRDRETELVRQMRRAAKMMLKPSFKGKAT
ncbi:HK97 family phage prohead protease [Rhizobium halophilum]|uniref:HK97 family phage prohead protease n=1 Tax=Rhizobium halophilum TaxID=2846852 RepID=UPI00374D03A5